MIFTYTQMDRAGTRLMHVLGLPTYIALLVLALVFPYGRPLLGFALAAVGVFVYQFVYSKALHLFVHQLQARRAAWQFISAVIAVQAIVLVGIYAAT